MTSLTLYTCCLKFMKRTLVFYLLSLEAQIAIAGEIYERGTLEVHTSNGAHRFIVELAKTPKLRLQGLMFRKSLPVNTGMLFMFDNMEVQQMWMHNTLIPLDMLFTDDEHKIIKIEHNTTPMTKTIISSEIPAIWVLELRGGTSKRLGLKLGDHLILDGIIR